MTFARWVAGGFGSGMSPAAPGTAGSLAGLAIGALLLTWSPWAVSAGALAATFGGIWAIAASGARDDPGWVVIDEIAGILLAILPLHRPSAAGLVFAFLLFRLLDIAKPGPVGWADRRHGPVFIMADDVIAGVMTASALWLLTFLEPGWFL